MKSANTRLTMDNEITLTSMHSLSNLFNSVIYMNKFQHSKFYCAVIKLNVGRIVISNY